MALPTFSAPGISVVFSKTRFFPLSDNIQQPNQIRGTSDDGTVFVANLGETKRFIRCSFRQLPSIDIDSMITFLNDPSILYSLGTFTWTDESGTQYTVRFWDPIPFAPVASSPQQFNVDFTLRVE